MPEFSLSIEAQEDLTDIARYTAEVWGLGQAEKYLEALASRFQKIAEGDVVDRPAFEHRRDFRMVSCQRHVIFFVRDDSAQVTILAVFHERMNLMARLRQRIPLDD